MEPLLDLDGARALRTVLEDLGTIAAAAPAAAGACAFARSAFRDAFVDGRPARWGLAVAAAADVVSFAARPADGLAGEAVARLGAFVSENDDLLAFARTA